MKNFDIKFKHIFIPYLIVSAGTIIAYGLLRWLLVIKYSLITVDIDILDFWVPCFFVLAPVYIWIGPRIKIMDLTAKGLRSDPFAGLLLLATITIVAPTIIAQTYLETATGKLTSLDRISQIDSIKQTQYYSVKTFYADKHLSRFYASSIIHSKSNKYEMHIYVAVPVYNSNHTIKTYRYSIGENNDTARYNNALIVINGKRSTKDTLKWINPRAIKNITVLKGKAAKKLYGDSAKNGIILIETAHSKVPDTLQVIHDDNSRYKCHAWLALRYEKTVSNRLSLYDKDQAYKQFAKETQAKFDSTVIDKFIYLYRLPYGNDMKSYLAAVNSDRYSPVPATKNLFVPVFESFDKRNGDKLLWIFGTFAIGSMIFLLLLLAKPLRSDLEYRDHSTDTTQQIIDELTGKTNN